MIPSKWALTEESDILGSKCVCACVCVCVYNAREEGAGFPFPSKEKSSRGAVSVLNKSQIRSPCKREEGRGEWNPHKVWAAHWSKPSPYLSSLSERSKLFFSFPPPPQLPELGMSQRWQPPTLPPLSSLSLSPNPPPLRPALQSSLPFCSRPLRRAPLYESSHFWPGQWNDLHLNTLPVSSITWLTLMKHIECLLLMFF